MSKRQVASKWQPRKRIRAARAKFKSETDDSDVSSVEEILVKAEPTSISTEVATPASIIKKELDFEMADLDQLKPQAEAPAHWQTFISKIREMRRLKTAPVDLMGCYETTPSQLDAKIVRFQHLVTLMLSSQTKDEVTTVAMLRLREQLTPTLTPEAVLNTPELDLAALLRPVGFYRRKAQHLQQTAAILLERYGGDVPRTVPEMMALPGVGPKMAHLLLQIAWREAAGIGVDVHVHRLAHMWHWVPNTEHPTPEKTRMALEKWLPRPLWLEINPLLVGFGQTWCPSRKTVAKCNVCHLNSLCPGSAADLPP